MDDRRVGRAARPGYVPFGTGLRCKRLPQVFNLGVSENSRGQSGGSGNITYGTAINLRGIGPYSTLTLLDGHRAVPQGTTGFAVDPSVVPTLALERVEVVADGASAIYGSDAIAGVVNLIPRRQLEGVEISLRGAQGDEYDEHQLGAIGGFSWGGVFDECTSECLRRHTPDRSCVAPAVRMYPLLRPASVGNGRFSSAWLRSTSIQSGA